MTPLSAIKVLAVEIGAAGPWCSRMLADMGAEVVKIEPLSGDLLREPVTWAEGNIAKMKVQNVSLRFTLRGGQFYSYWLE